MDFYLIGSRIKKARLKKNLTQEKLAELTGLSIQHISNIENGRSKLSIESLISISSTLDVSTDHLLQDNVLMENPRHIKFLASKLNNCSKEELDMLTDIIDNSLNFFEKYNL
ncbi:helix-turn-helix domain-containing protein [Enterococcus sp. C78]|jgi:transcriptional regulator with XRE-family HTH domain|uniref:helix-turn-helix domain-containing protein n=1 Tax=Enterococcus sp. C78 TaxID=3231336 RepID=UPI0034A0544B